MRRTYFICDNCGKRGRIDWHASTILQDPPQGWSKFHGHDLCPSCNQLVYDAAIYALNGTKEDVGA